MGLKELILKFISKIRIPRAAQTILTKNQVGCWPQQIPGASRKLYCSKNKMVLMKRQTKVKLLRAQKQIPTQHQT